MMMAETKSGKRLIYSIEEFRRTYLPKEMGEVEMPAGSNQSDFGVDLAKKIMRRIDIKKIS